MLSILSRCFTDSILDTSLTSTSGPRRSHLTGKERLRVLMNSPDSEEGDWDVLFERVLMIVLGQTAAKKKKEGGYGFVVTSPKSSNAKFWGEEDEDFEGEWDLVENVPTSTI
jgi:hypothetical protein